MALSLPWHPLLSSKPQKHNFHRPNLVPIRRVTPIRAFRRSDFDGFTKRLTSGELWRDAWRSTNDRFEQFVYDTRKTAERIDRNYAFSRRLSEVAQSAADRARELDRDFQISQKWRTFSMDFSRNLPRYRRQLSDFLDTQLGKSIATVFFLWLALSGWLFRILIFATWVLPFAGPLLIGAIANNLVIKGECPACKRPFAGAKSQTVRCANCGNIVWQPQGDFFSRGGRGGGTSSSSKSQPDIIDVEFEEK
ncbi:hypothetical protein PHJA_002360400 [Phtheirospermum japonicum]|uniref:Uncharacterized protein n=1 Tax=Phtheirospermum japonicum TaxID=374723 RepID=A0A830D168_9LAMI|nr:hypothetical protein PHJA_002360400 [Phtheirospermum japonicum]